jgi:uncharacterized protein YndB with AHSA1/START domain
MGLLLIILGSIAGLFALILLIAAVTKKEYTVQRSVVINRPKEQVYDYLRHLKNQDRYSKWVMRDPNMKKTYTGTDGEVGFIYAWDGNKHAGAGEQEITRLVPNELVNAEIRFIRPFAAVAQTPFVIEGDGDDTKVTWSMSSSMKYPTNIMLLMMNMNKLLGKDMEESLEMLKKQLEEA